MVRCVQTVFILFQSTPPARGATSVASSFQVMLQAFQSTPPARGATLIWLIRSRSACISIHAPREGGDEDALGYAQVNA